MAVVQRAPQHSVNSTTVADLLERVLDKGVVIAGDIKVSLVDIELLSIQIRLVICSVDKAKEMGMDWWANHPVFSPKAAAKQELGADTLLRLEQRLASIEQKLVEQSPVPTPAIPAPVPPSVPAWVDRSEKP
jgi:hypothetical protein